ncbi:hypothetical protein COOONC_05385 [Cooperia oncophora]
MFLAAEALNAYELVKLKQLNSWTTNFYERARRDAELTATSEWSCMGRFSTDTIDLWSPILLFNICIASAATALSYEGLFIRENLPHYEEKVKNYLNEVSLYRRNEVEKCQRDLLFTAIGPWLLLCYWQTTAISSDWITASSINMMAGAFAFSWATCSFLQTVVTTPKQYSTLMWYAMKILPARCSPKFDPVTMFTREEICEAFRQREKAGNRSDFVHARVLPIFCPVDPVIFRLNIARHCSLFVKDFGGYDAAVI